MAGNQLFICKKNCEVKGSVNLLEMARTSTTSWGGAFGISENTSSTGCLLSPRKVGLVRPPHGPVKDL